MRSMIGAAVLCLGVMCTARYAADDTSSVWFGIVGGFALGIYTFIVCYKEQSTYCEETK